MGKFIFGFLLGALFAFASAPYVFPFGIQAAAQHFVQDIRDKVPAVKAYVATP